MTHDYEANRQRAKHMAFADLRAFIDGAARIGEVKNIDGAHWHLEIGCLTELMAEQDGPLLVFDNIRSIIRAAFASPPMCSPAPAASRSRSACRLTFLKLEILKTWRNKTSRSQTLSRRWKFLPGRLRRTSSKARRIDLEFFPTPKWHEHDGGRYIGTGDMVIMKDPDSGWVNVGTYRSCVVDRDRVTLWIIEHKHGKQIARKYWRAGRPCPVAIVLGCEPATWMAAPSAAKAGVSEYEYAGALRGASLEVIRAPFTGLPIPATSEIVIEGEMPSPEVETHAEGPFGEWPGYYTHSGEECVVRVKRDSASQRSDPVGQSAAVADHRTLRHSALRRAHLGSLGAIRHLGYPRRVVPLPHVNGGGLTTTTTCGPGAAGPGGGRRHADRREHVPLLHRRR